MFMCVPPVNGKLVFIRQIGCPVLMSCHPSSLIEGRLLRKENQMIILVSTSFELRSPSQVEASPSSSATVTL
jgi:hypothetical protein